MRFGSLVVLAIATLCNTDAGYAQQLDPSRMLTHVRYLAQDELAGRETGEPGADSAAAYISAQFESYGLEPLFEDGASYRQTFSLATTLGVEPASQFLMEAPEGSVVLELGAEWYPFSFSSAGEVTGRAASVGHGMQEADFEVLKSRRANVAIIDGSTPDDWNPHTGGDPSLLRRATLAREAGAKAALIIVSELNKPQIGDLPRELGIPVVQVVGSPSTTPWLTNPFVRVGLTANVAPLEATVYNVGGRLRGTNSDGRTIVIGAHYDHLGMGGPGSLAPDEETPHNGADDNASGTSLLLELARYFAMNANDLSVDLAFVAFTGEEMGLLGSNHFVSNSPLPLEKIAAMLNFDMVGRLRDGKLQIFGTETATEFPDILDAASEDSDLKVSRVGDGYGPSDQTSFYARRVPVLHFFSGTHSEYHRPEDDWDLINVDGMSAIGDFAIDIVRRLETSPGMLTYVEQQRPQSSGRRGYGPYLGTIPDFNPVDGGGLAISGVRSESPAEKAGLTGGDVIVRFGGKDVMSINDYAVALREHVPGDSVAIQVRRDGKLIDMTAVLGKRD
ncbi:MAG: M28 family peptidase [Rhodothermales bacterium]|nr:M28 family peptidase [Rhodothermales bacterium]